MSVSPEIKMAIEDEEKLIAAPLKKEEPNPRAAAPMGKPALAFFGVGLILAYAPSNG
jgi:hypothetical protein